MPESKYYLNYLIRAQRWPQSFYHRAKFKMVNKLIEELYQGARILDAGCGIGNITAKYCQDYQIIGIDEQPAAIEYCQKNCAGEYLKARVENLPFDASSFDLVLFLDVIEHLADPLPALQELRRVLKVGKKILIWTPNYGNPGWYVLENVWHRFFAGNCRTYSAQVHPTRYNRRRIAEHANQFFYPVEIDNRMLAMELYYLGQR
jgi:ubiquinone/menaquinone biosynthesis C-methylase UbiE